MAETIKRIFIAVEFSENTRLELTKLRKLIWPDTLQGIRWISVDQIHLTLKFIGDTPLSQIPAVQAVCQTACSDIPRIPIMLSGFGVFPNQQAPSVLWAGIQENPSLNFLQSQLEENLAKLGIPREKRAFKPHLTLARMHAYLSPDQRERIMAPLTHPDTYLKLSTQLAALTLFESQLARSGAIYTKIATFPLP